MWQHRSTIRSHRSLTPRRYESRLHEILHIQSHSEDVQLLKSATTNRSSRCCASTSSGFRTKPFDAKCITERLLDFTRLSEIAAQAEDRRERFHLRHDCTGISISANIARNASNTSRRGTWHGSARLSSNKWCSTCSPIARLARRRWLGDGDARA